MRGMIKWAPFNSLINGNDINDIIKKRNRISKPSICKDRIISIDFNIKEATTYNKEVRVKYFNKYALNYVIGLIDKVNINEKYIQVNNTRIYFKNIIDLKIID